MDKFVVRRAGPASSTQPSREREPADERQAKRTKTEHKDTPSTGGNEHVLLDYLKEEDDDETVDSGGDLDLVADSYEGVPFEEPLAAIEATDQVIEDEYGATEGDRVEGKPLYRSSIYVDAFNIALDTVLEQEEHLFNKKEKAVFAAWRGLDYEAQYLYVRLFLRKEAAWHRTQRLSYSSNIGDLQAAIDTLQKEHKLPKCEEDDRKSLLSEAVPQDWSLGETLVFAQSFDSAETTVEEAVALLSLDELKAMAKQMKGIGKTKAELQSAIVHMGTRQRTLMSAGLRRHSSTDSAVRTPGTPASPGTPVPELRRDSTTSSNRGEQLIDKVAAITGPCIRICPSVFKLFERVHLVFYRTSEWTEKSLTTIVLAKMSKRNFPEYIVSRTANIFESRQQLLDFEAALRLQYRVDHVLNSGGQEDGFREIICLFQSIVDHWRALLEEEKRQDEMDDFGAASYLRRFKAAHVFTRIAHYAAHCLGRLHEYADEYALLQELLNQRLLHLARRGAWYQRKALLEERYMAAASPNPQYKDEAQQKKYWWRKALETCEQALQDRDCHLIYHFDLQKRILKLEKRLRIPRRLQHDFGHARLLAPEEHFVEGVQIKRDEGVLPHLTRKPSSGDNIILDPDGTVKSSSGGGSGLGGMSTKTAWLDEGDHDEVDGVGKSDNSRPGECSVEQMCLNDYRKRGWKGYHSEGGIVRTLFAYLFYDILFLFIPNVFQTAYQACPLDLHTDTFYPSRASEINRRLVEIANGEAPRIVQQVHAAHFERRTCIVGLQWDFSLDDMLELAQCFRGDALALVCKVLAQEYRQRGGGLPDLLLWRLEPTPEVLFSEVKSANDRLSDTQRMWIHVLAGAGLRVAVCHAVAKQVKVR